MSQSSPVDSSLRALYVLEVLKVSEIWIKKNIYIFMVLVFSVFWDIWQRSLEWGAETETGDKKNLPTSCLHSLDLGPNKSPYCYM